MKGQGCFEIASEEELGPKSWAERTEEGTSKDLDGKMEKGKKGFDDESRRKVYRFLSSDKCRT